MPGSWRADRYHSGRAMSSPSNSEGSAAEILLVEDDHGDVRHIREVFDEANIVNELHVVYDGEEARRRRLHRDPHVCLTTPLKT